MARWRTQFRLLGPNVVKRLYSCGGGLSHVNIGQERGFVLRPGLPAMGFDPRV